MMIGDDDACRGSVYTKTVRCKTKTAELLAMSISDFLQRVKYHEDTWNFIQSNASKRFEFEQNVTKMNHRLKNLKSNEVVNGIKEQDKLHFLDFIKGNFWNRPIPEKKIETNIKRRVNQRRIPASRPTNAEISSRFMKEPVSNQHEPDLTSQI